MRLDGVPELAGLQVVFLEDVRDEHEDLDLLVVHLLHRLDKRLLSLAVKFEISLVLGKLSFLSLQLVILLDNLPASLFQHEVVLLLGMPQGFHFLIELAGRRLLMGQVDGPDWVKLGRLVGRQLLQSLPMQIMVHRVVHAFLHRLKVPRNPLGWLGAGLVFGFIRRPRGHLNADLTFWTDNGRYWNANQHIKCGTHSVDVI